MSTIVCHTCHFNDKKRHKCTVDEHTIPISGTSYCQLWNSPYICEKCESFHLVHPEQDTPWCSNTDVELSDDFDGEMPPCFMPKGIRNK
jgi:hypothetical protein